MKDITDRADIEKLVTRFYARVRKDPKIGYIFTEVMKVDFDHHIPRIVDFWEAVLFQKTRFDGNPLSKHMVVDENHPLEPEHFNRWLELFHSTLNELFSGKTAEEAKYRSRNIAGVFMQHLESRKNGPRFEIGSLD